MGGVLLQQSVQLLCFGPMAGHMVQMTRCEMVVGWVRGRGSIFEHCHSEAWTLPTSSPSLLSLPPPSLPLFSPGIPFPCVIRLLIKAVDVERMNAHCRPCLSLCLSLSLRGALELHCKSATQRPRAGSSDKFSFCIFNIDLRIGMFSLLINEHNVVKHKYVFHEQRIT